MHLFAVAAGIVSAAAVAPSAESGSGLVINGFWLIVALLNFVLLYVVLQLFAFGPISRMLADRRSRIEQGLKDAEQARRDRESGEQERLTAIQEARREANEILSRAQKVASETREQDLAATREELGKMRERAASDFEAEKERAIAELRSEVADLALSAASRVVGESMTGERQHKLVTDFLAEPANTGGSNA
jgi:F-type H+-transporting ATPase subunit b